MSERAGSGESLQQRLVALQQEALVLAHDLLEQLGQVSAVSSVAEVVRVWLLLLQKNDAHPEKEMSLRFFFLYVMLAITSFNRERGISVMARQRM